MIRGMTSMFSIFSIPPGPEKTGAAFRTRTLSVHSGPVGAGLPTGPALLTPARRTSFQRTDQRLPSPSAAAAQGRRGVAVRRAAGRQEGARQSLMPRVRGRAPVLSWRVREAILWHPKNGLSETPRLQKGKVRQDGNGQRPALSVVLRAPVPPRGGA